MKKPSPPTAEAVTQALNAITDPSSGQGLASAGRISGVDVRPDGVVRFVVEAPPGAGADYESVRAAAQAAVSGLTGVTKVLAALTAPTATAVRLGKGAGAPPPTAPPTAPQQPRQALGLAGVGAIIAVSSAKGGVGKSTVAVNLACALSSLGKRVGLLDADVYGPSLPTLLGLERAEPERRGEKLIPILAHGLKAMSIGFIVDVDAPMIWRGPMATSALRQMFDDVDWAPLDILVLDLPPGTGDVQLTIAQRIPLSGAVIVSTPQAMALADVRRGIAMFERTHIPILGLIENMAWFELPDGERVNIFGEGGAQKTAADFGVPLLGALPIDIPLRESADAGAPLVRSAPESAMAQKFMQIAKAVLAGLETAVKPPPKIRFA
jgi:ATP-binding protein involved in chromosome partitioning